MNGKQLHDFLFQLYDYADTLADKIEPGNVDNGKYFLSLVAIEQMFDTYARGLVSESARQSNDPSLVDSESLKEAHQRIDKLRERIHGLSKLYNFDDVLDRERDRLGREWRH